ncbi:hypothetical protein [Paenibacillus turpanensis]|uniref:hypothetical protein n=1 Tax=Paenibacillus turpanensis TaxID=2689078 RepID=UPI00140853F3|nr:hypothetical protein [Paenibacillus turpanensis]
MNKKVQIYKHDKWNMLTVEIQGKQLVVREISDQWGEDTRTFLSRPELMNWANHRFSEERYQGSEEERQAILEALGEV